MRKFVLLALALPLTVYAHDPAWIVYGPDGPSARTIVTGECPDITIDGATHRMRTRSLPGKNYPVRGCEMTLPAGAREASIGETVLAVAKLGRIEKIAILGDTGCRLKKGSKPQDCKNIEQWPLKTVADSIAKWDPDLILNVGDYYYREATLRNGQWVPSTYNWKRWDEDWFTPTHRLLPNAPWVMVRGNHEDCDRAAEGWFRFLEPRSYVWENTKTCKSNTDYTPPYDLNIAGLRLVIFDSSAVEDWHVVDEQVTIMANQLALYAKKSAGAWFMLHHPFWAVGPGGPDTETMWTAWQKAGNPNAAMALTGHLHLLEFLSFSDDGIPQMVVGNGGTRLDSAPPDPKGTPVGGRTISEFYVDDDFGFVTATHDGGAWTFEVRDTDGKVKATCGWREGTALSCK